MTIEADIYTTLQGLVGGRCFPDVAPLTTVRPYITYTQIGGEAISYVENTLPSSKNGRFQVNVWADTRASASSTILLVEAALLTSSTFQARAVGAPSSGYEPDVPVYGSMQDFSIWSNR